MMKCDMITKIFWMKRQTQGKKETYQQLRALFNGNRYKASASIGGSVASGYLKEKNGQYICMRDAI